MNKEYEVCGPTEILGHSPGVKFTADLSDFQEKTLIEGGGLKVVGEVPPVEPTSEEPVIPDDNKSPVEPGTPEENPPSGEKKGKF